MIKRLEPIEPKQAKKRALFKLFKLLHRKPFMIGGMVLTLLATASVMAVVFFGQRAQQDILPREAYKDLTFPAYFPKRLPEGLTFDRKSVSSKPLVLAYTFTFENSHSVYVSIQPLDPQLDVNSFNPTRTISTEIGEGYLVEYDERTTIAIVTPKALVLINAQEKIPGYAIEQLAYSLKPVN